MPRGRPRKTPKSSAPGDIVAPAGVPAAPRPPKSLTESQRQVLLAREIQALEDQSREIEKLKANLPHRYGKMYAWQRHYFTSTAQMYLLVAANQVGKSSILQRRMIERAVDKSQWARLWPKAPVPRVFWYLYPTLDLATKEFEEKWVPDWLPRGIYERDAVYGWKANSSQKVINSVEFNSGVTIYFRSYTQNLMALQAGTVWELVCDEELPQVLYPELMSRLNATGGYYSQGFTGTLVEDMWYRAMECIGKDSEMFPGAEKKIVSLYDCQKFDDGTPGRYDIETINAITRRFSYSPHEVRRRVFGRLVRPEGLKYAAYDPERNMIKPQPIPRDWIHYAGVDPGGGESNARLLRKNAGNAHNGVQCGGHPPAIVFVAIRPDYRLGYVYKVWLGDDGKEYTNGDTFNKYMELVEEGGVDVPYRYYDWHTKDFAMIAERAGYMFEKADKSHELGVQILNTLFRFGALFIFNNDGGQKLSSQLMSLNAATSKTSANDDAIDGLRYAVTKALWDFKFIERKSVTDLSSAEALDGMTAEERAIARQIEERRAAFKDETHKDDAEWDFEAEVSFWNECAGS